MKNNSIQNIIFIIADTLRAKNVGLYGAKPSPTPNIDKLGRSGVVFMNAYTTITKTDPAITAIITGEYPVSTGLVNHGMHVTREEEKSLENANFLPEILKQNGWKTAAIDWLGRWHKRGFDYYSGEIGRDFRQDYPMTHRLPLPLYLRIIDKIAVKYLRREFLVRSYYALSPDPKIPYDTADKIVDKAIEIFRGNKQKQLFLYLHFWDTHAPHTRPRGFRSYLFDNVDDTYNAEISFLDEQIGRLIAYLKQTSQLEKTLIVFTADHGENFYEHDTPFNHENLYEDIVKVPFLLSHGSVASQKIDKLVQHIDLFPTILDLLSISVPNNIDGKSLLPLMRGKNKLARAFLYFEDITNRKIDIPKQTRRRGIRIGKYKYIETLIGKKEDLYRVMPREDLSVVHEELYDLESDSLEKKRFIYEKPNIVKRLRKELHVKILELNMKRLQNNNPNLYTKVEKSLRIIKKAAKQYKNYEVAVAWTGGKDSTVLLHLVRMAFDGKIPFKVIFNNSTMEFKEIYDFIDKVSKLWGINVIIIKHSEQELKEFHATKDRERKKELSRLMKITAINTALKRYRLKALMAGIRWDEHESRSKERYFSPRPDHMRIHPLLHFTEKDIWEYIKHFGVPYVSLYDKGYRSLGEKPFTKPVPPGGSERSGREREKEQLMQRLRKLGYW